MKMISIIIPCYNEAENVVELHSRLTAVCATFPQYRFEILFIDNASTDGTVAEVKAIIDRDASVRLIVNARNFGQVRSPYYALMQASGDAVMCMAADLQDPPELISQFINAWEEGYRVVAGVKQTSRESRLMWLIRTAYYRAARKMSEVPLLEHFTGFGLYDRCVVEVLRGLDDPYPYFRGLIAEIGYPVKTVKYDQPGRVRGITKNNFYTLYDLAMLGITSHSKVPIRLATMAGFGLAIVSFLISLVYLVLKLIFWSQFQLGTAPLLIGIFFFASVQLFFIGLIGEYVASIHTQVLRRPLVVEQARFNFNAPPFPVGSSARPFNSNSDTVRS